MTNKEILEKAIVKAINNGFSFSHIYPALVDDSYEIHDGDGDVVFYNDAYRPNPWSMSFERLVFNHDFTRALWGDDIRKYRVSYDYKATLTSGGGSSAKAHLMVVPALDEWQYHLQQMVISKDPIEYLGDNI